MAFDEIPKEDGLQVLLMGLDSQGATEVCDFRKASRLPILLERLLDEELLPGRERGCAADALEIQKLSEAVHRLCVLLFRIEDRGSSRPV